MMRVTHPPLPSERGFTLVEMMIALLIFGLLAAAGVALLSFSVKAQGITAAKLDDIAAIGRLSSSLSADLAQASDRATRDEDGTLQPAFVGESAADGAALLQFVRGGWSNLDESARPGQQKVEYRLDGGILARVAYPMLDGAAPLRAATLLQSVAAVTMRYRIGGAWTDRWDGSTGIALPEAVEMIVTRTDGTQFRGVYLVGTGYGVAPQAEGGANGEG